MKKAYKKVLSWLLILCLLIGLFPVLTLPAMAGVSKAASLPTSPGSVLVNDTVYTVASSVTINAGAGQSALIVAPGATVVIYIPAEVKLTVNGGNGSSTVGGGAGISLPSTSTLILCGEGQLVAGGGAGYQGIVGATGTAFSTSGSGGGWYAGINFTSGAGGAGGKGGSSPGAAIGGSGVVGGAGGAGAASSVMRHDTISLSGFQSLGYRKGNNGSNGTSGIAGTGMGTLYVLNSVSVTATRGSQSTIAGGAGAGNTSLIACGWDNSQNKGGTFSVGGGGGGGGGGTAGSSANIGGSGSGGGGGGGGSSGGFFFTNLVGGNTWDATIYPGCGGGGGGERGAGGSYYAQNATEYRHNNEPVANALFFASAGIGSASFAGGSGGQYSTTYSGKGGNGGSRSAGGAGGTIYWGSTSPALVTDGGNTANGDGAKATVITNFTLPDAIKFTITLNAQGGTSMPNQNTAFYQHLTDLAETPVRLGYTFNGYFTAATGDAMLYDSLGRTQKSVSGFTDSSGRWIYAANLTLYAQWTPKTYEVSFVMGGMISDAGHVTKSAPVTYDRAFTQSVVPPGMPTHDFAGYYSEPGGNGVKFFGVDGTPVQAVWTDDTVNPRLYAAWEKKPMPTALQNGSFETPAVNNWTKMLAQGTQELYWKTSSSDGIIEFGRPRLNQASAQSSYNAGYAAEGEQFAELNANVPGALFQTITTIPGEELVWGLSHHGRNGTDTMEVWIGAPGDVLAACQEYSKGGNNVNKVNGALRDRLKSLPTTGVNENGDSTLTGAKTIASNKDQWYRYTGSYTVPSGQAQTTFAFVSVSASGNNPSVGNLLDNIYFCQPALIPTATVPVTVNPPMGGSVNVLVDGFLIDTAENGHTVSIHPSSAAKVTFASVPNNEEYIPIGAVVNGSFVDYNTFKDAEYSGKLEVSVLFAKKGTVILDPCGGVYQGQSGEVKLTVDAGNSELTPASAQKTGLRFGGWKVASGAGGMQPVTKVAYVVEDAAAYLVAYNGSTEVCRVETEAGGLVLLAQYGIPVIDKASITFHLEGGMLNGLPEPGSGDQNVVYTLDPANTSLKLLAPVREGYTFGGWTDGEGSYPVGQSFSYSVDAGYNASLTFGGQPKALNLTLTAQWSVTPYSLTLNANGGTLKTPVTEYTPGTALPLPVPTKTGYIFGGWYADSALTLPLSGSTIPADATGARIYYAAWTLCSHTGNTTPGLCEAAAPCSVCGASLPAIGHDWSAYAHNADSETCYSYGTKTRTCEHDASHTETVTDTGYGYAAHELQEDWMPAQLPSCDEDGIESRGCHTSECSYVEYRPVDATGHDTDVAEDSEFYETVTDPTCTAAGIVRKHCKVSTAGEGRCGWYVEESVPALGHEPSTGWSKDASFHWHDCTVCGENLDMAAHNPVSGGEAIGEGSNLSNPLNSVSCSVCGYAIRAAKHTVTNTASTPQTFVYAGAAVDTATYFTPGAGAGAPAYYLIPVTGDNAGQGSIHAVTGALTVTRAGEFLIGMTTEAGGDYLAGEEVALALTVGKASQTAPSPLAEEAGAWGILDGRITNLTPNTPYELRLNGQGELWRSVSSDAEGHITGLGAGTYSVRLPGSGLYEESPSGSAVIGQPPRTFTIGYVHNIPAEQGSFTPSLTEYISDLTAGINNTLEEPVRTGHTFAGWYTSSGFSGAPVTVVDGKTETGSKMFYAKWTVNRYNISLTATSNGAVSVSSAADYNAEVNLTLEPLLGYEPDTLTVTGDGGNVPLTGSGNAYSFTMPDYHLIVTAAFKEIQSRKDVSDSLTAALAGPWSTEYNTAAGVREWIAEKINLRFAADGIDLPVTSGDIRLDTFVPSVYGMPGVPGTFGFTLTLNDSVRGTWSKTVTGGIITKKDRIAGSQVVTVPVPVKNASQAGTGGVTLSSPLQTYANCTAITWNPAGASFLGETVYTASVTLTARGGALFEQSFLPVVPGGTVKNIVVAPDGTGVTFDVLFPPTGAKLVSGLAVDTPPSHDGDKDTMPDYKYMAGDDLDLAGLRIKVTYDDGTYKAFTLAELSGAYLTIDGAAVSANIRLFKAAHDAKSIVLHHAGKTFAIGTLTVYNPAVGHLSSVYGMTVAQGAVGGAATTLSITRGDRDFDYTLTLGSETKASDTNLNANVTSSSVSLAGLIPDTAYILTLTVTDHALGREYVHTQTFRTPAVVPAAGHTLNGGGLNPNHSNVFISLVRGNEVLATVMAVQDDPANPASFAFTFENVPAGRYNLVADNGEWIVTYGVTLDVHGNTDKSILIDMGTGKTQSTRECLPGAPAVVADGLPDLFENNAIYTADNAELVQAAQGMVEISLVSSGESGVMPQDRSDLLKEAGSQRVELLFDLSMYKTCYTSAGELQSSERLTTLYGDLLMITVDLPAGLAAKPGFTVYRIHEGISEKMQPFPDCNASGEYYTIDGDQLTLWVNQFSAYALAFDPPSGGGRPPVLPPVVSGSVPGDVSALLNTDDHFAYMVGDDKGLFNPEKNMTRAEAAQMFYNLLRGKNLELTVSFPDVPDSAWYAKAAGVLASIGVIGGYPDGCFEPNRPITRAEFVTIAARFSSAAAAEGTFEDVPRSHWAYPSINSAAALDWIDGVGGNLFMPDRNVTRAEVVKIVNNMLDRAPDMDAIDTWDTLRQFPDLDKHKWYFYDVMEAANPHAYVRESQDHTETWQSP